MWGKTLGGGAGGERESRKEKKLIDVDNSVVIAEGRKMEGVGRGYTGGKMVMDLRLDLG